MIDDTHGSGALGMDSSTETDKETRMSPEAVLEIISAETSDAALFPGSMREEWFFTYDLLMDQTTMSRFIKKMNVGKIVYLPHYRLSWPFYYPPQNSALPSLERTNHSEDVVWGIIFESKGKDFTELERFLRVPNRYHRSAIQVQDRGGRRFPAFTYVLTRQDDAPRKPSSVYRDKLIEIAADRQLPDEWLSILRGLEVEN